jgi:hypothetical protein
MEKENKETPSYVIIGGIKKQVETYHLITCRVRRNVWYEEPYKGNLNDWDEVSVLVPVSVIESKVAEYFAGPNKEAKVAWDCDDKYDFNANKTDDDILCLWTFYKTIVQIYTKDHSHFFPPSDIYYSDEPKIITKMWYFDIKCWERDYNAKTLEETLIKEESDKE